MPSFQIGLTMAGAISAGAYSAGVFDFLAEALSEWGKARPGGGAGLPQHHVVIKAISGASAGAIVGALGPLALADGIAPQDDLPPALGLPRGAPYNPHRCVLPALYTTWVNLPRMTPQRPGGSALLTTEDLTGPAPPAHSLVSLLNTSLLDSIRDGAIVPRPAAPGPVTHPFIAEQLHLFLMLGNLHGVPYEISFQSVDAAGQPKKAVHSMLMHGDRAHFRLDGLGSAAVPRSAWANDGTPIVMEVASLFGGQTQPDDAWRHYGQAAVASAAFPVGLRARDLKIDSWTYITRAWPIPIDDGVAIAPSGAWQAGHAQYGFLSVDGGTLNNEPFDYARWALLDNPTADNARDQPDGEHADRAVIMVDPFPEGPDFKFDTKESPAIRLLLGRIIGMYVNQARFKLEELAAASADTVFSRFLIAPRRSAGGQSFDGQAAIACGLLGGFGGFLDEKFRAHDYQLGRRNCQNFLRHAFTLPVSNRPLGLAEGRYAAINRNFITHDDKGGAFVPIIPLVGSAALEVPAPLWPRMSPWDLADLRPHVSRRAYAVAVQALKETVKSKFFRFGLRLIWCAYGRGLIVNTIMQTIEDDLKARGHLSSVWDGNPAVTV